MEAFIDAFYAISQGGSERIFKKDLDAYAREKNLDSPFSERWLAMFDQEGKGYIDIQEFLHGMGLHPENVLRRVSTSQIEAYEKVQVVAGDAPEEMQKEIINILIRVKKLYGSNSRQLIEQLKVRLDRRFGAVWQCTVVRGAYTTCNAHVPGTNMCFRYGGMSYILYKSAQFDGNTDDDDFGGSDSQ